MKVLITGANGLLGQKISAICHNHPRCEVLATGLGPSRQSSSIGYRPMDISVDSEVRSVLQSFRPEVILHAAAITQVDYCELHRRHCDEVNIRGTENLLNAAVKLDSQFVFVSTDFVFNGRNGPYKEEDAPDPVNYYGESKLHAERLVMDSGLHWSVVRTVLVYGVGDQMRRSNILLWAINNLKNNVPLRVVNDQWRTPTLAEDLAEGCVQVMLEQKGGLWHLSGEEMTTPYDLVRQIARHFDLNLGLVGATDASAFKETATRPPKTGFIVEKARSQLGYKPRSIREGLLFLDRQIRKQLL